MKMSKFDYGLRQMSKGSTQLGKLLNRQMKTLKSLNELDQNYALVLLTYKYAYQHDESVPKQLHLSKADVQKCLKKTKHDFDK